MKSLMAAVVLLIVGFAIVIYACGWTAGLGVLCLLWAGNIERSVAEKVMIEKIKGAGHEK